MTLEHVIIFVLLGVIVFLVVYQSRVQKNLVDRLMSRNYAEYVQVTKPSSSQPVKLPDPADEQDVLNELNSMLGGR